MDIGNCQDHLRKAILAISPVHEKAWHTIQKFIIPENIPANKYFCKAGDYSMYFSYICHGLFRSYYRDINNKEHCTGFYCNQMFMLPLPAFLYRKPAFQFFQAIQDSTIVKIKYAEIENLARKQSSVNDFLRTLIDREWIIKKELMLASKHIYNQQTRFQLFQEQYQTYVSHIPLEYISSYLNIPEKNLLKMIQQQKNRFIIPEDE
jgi:CRP-like cAMP-binding protein